MNGTDLDEGEVGHDRFDLFDDFRLGARVERFELHVEDRLFLRLRGNFFFARSRIIRTRCPRTRKRSCGACSGEGDFLDVQTRLYVCVCQKGEKKPRDYCFWWWRYTVYL